MLEPGRVQWQGEGAAWFRRGDLSLLDVVLTGGNRWWVLGVVCRAPDVMCASLVDLCRFAVCLHPLGHIILRC